MEIRAWSDAYLPRIFYPRRNSAAFLFPFIPTDKRFFNVTIRARNERIPSFFLFCSRRKYGVSPFRKCVSLRLRELTVEKQQAPFEEYFRFRLIEFERR